MISVNTRGNNNEPGAPDPLKRAIESEINFWSLDFQDYVLDLSGADLTQTGLSSEQLDGYEWLWTTGSELQEAARLQQVPPEVLLPSIVAMTGADETSNPNTLRLRCGGDLPAVPAGADELTEEICRIAIDVYPVVLAQASKPPLAGEVTWIVGTAVFRHPRADSLRALVLADPSLSKFFPNADGSGVSGVGYESAVVLSTGSSKSFSSSQVADAAIDSAMKTCIVKTGALDPQAFVNEVASTVGSLRTLADGGPITIPTAIGLANVALPVRGTASLPWATLRAVGEYDKALGGGMIGTVGTHLVMVVPVAVNCKVQRQVSQSPDALTGEDYESVIQGAVEKTALAVLLAEGGGPFVTVTRTWSMAPDPFPGQGYEFKPGAGLGGVQRRLTPDECASVETWATRIDKRYDDVLGIAVRRLISATSMRENDTDRLIDAVIALESLFGSRSAGNLSFRIAACVARLVGRSASDRDKFFHESKHIYNARSRVVHGDTEHDDATAKENAEKAIAIGVSSLREIIETRPELISERERSKRLLVHDDQANKQMPTEEPRD